MPEEIFIIVVIAILAGTFTSVVKMIVGYLQSQKSLPADKGSLTESQLRRMIEEAVDSSVMQLEGRFDRLDSRLNRLLESPDELPRLAATNDEAVDREVLSARRK